MIEQIGAFAGLAAFLGLAGLALLSFAHGRDIRRLREWAGSAPERDAERKEATSAMAAARAEELRRLEEQRNAEQGKDLDREERRRRREEGLPESGPLLDRFSARSRFSEPRYLVGSFVVFLALAAGAVYLVLGSSGDDGGTAAKGGGGAKKQKVAQLPASEVEVTVLNGTSTPGLAATYGDKIESKGFRLGTVSNSTESFSESVVMFERGHAPEARRVAKEMGVSDVRLITPEIETLAGGANVALIVGEDDAVAEG